MSADSIQTRVALIEDVLPEIADMLRDYQGRALNISTKSNAMDLVTDADRESESRLRRAIEKAFPKDDILGEEQGLEQRGADPSRYCWSLDPLDGTINYAHGLPLYAISVGLLRGEEPVAGLVTMPGLGNTYRAIRGEGATKDGKSVRVSETKDLSRALVVTGFPYDRQVRLPDLLRGADAILRHARGIRRTGSAAMDLCWVAEGRFDAHYEVSLNSWDVAAGSIIVTEAGGRLSDFSGRPHTPGMYQTVASNGHIHDAVIQVLAPIAHMAR
ncbi:MAG: inositol monophosphatase [Spirochaetales bacterium]|nr:inositol monophosphatase [Spirochaetales bacterium]